MRVTRTHYRRWLNCVDAVTGEKMCIADDRIVTLRWWSSESCMVMTSAGLEYHIKGSLEQAKVALGITPTPGASPEETDRE